MSTTTTRVANCKCRCCGALIDGATGVGDIVPEAGDVSICLYCATVSIFKNDLSLREPTNEEMIQIMADPVAAAHFKAREHIRKAVNNGDIKKRTPGN